ncbi:helix-turn-helix transcriptional regulator [Streptomyces sp.]|uniref:helix-turn-helix transcriptional regulator n=1 Tax=Streptomyces sp. TaxID=1931 RepID=UPI002F427C3E
MLPKPQPTPVWPAVAVHTHDPMTRDAVEEFLRSSGRITVLPPGGRHTAGVALLLTRAVTEQTLTWMREVSAAAEHPDMRTALVADGISERHLFQALGYGLIGFLPRPTATMPKIRQMVLDAAAGRAILPGSLVRSLIEQVKTVQRNVLEPHGLALAGFAAREIAVLRLLSEGYDTAELAQQLNYSERTVKKILADMMSRLSLRNRSHAVAYALQTGAI